MRFRIFSVVCMFVGMFFGMSMAHASPLTNLTVRYVGTYGNGVMFILFNSPIAETGCESSEVRIAANHPEKKNLMAMALAASQTGATLSVKTEGCSGAYPLFGETSGSVMFVWAGG